MTWTFNENMEFFDGINRARICLLALSTHSVVAQRVRILPKGVVVEIDRPLAIDGDVKNQNGYAAVEFGGCSVAWKLPEQ